MKTNAFFAMALFTVFSLLLISCKKEDSLPSAQARGRNIMYVSHEGKSYVFKDRRLSINKYKSVDLEENSSYLAFNTRFEENRFIPRTGRYADVFTLSMGSSRKASLFPFYGHVTFEINKAIPNLMDTVMTEMMLKVNGNWERAYAIEKFEISNYLRNSHALLLEGDMHVRYITNNDSINLGKYPDGTRGVICHVLIDKEI